MIQSELYPVYYYVVLKSDISKNLSEIVKEIKKWAEILKY